MGEGPFADPKSAQKLQVLSINHNGKKLKVRTNSISSPNSTLGINQNFTNFTSYLANCNKKTKIDTKEFFALSKNFLESVDNIKFMGNLKNKLVNFVSESKRLVDLVNNKNFIEVKKFVDKCSLLFKGPSGVRHVDFIAYKDD